MILPQQNKGKFHNHAYLRNWRWVITRKFALHNNKVATIAIEVQRLNIEMG
jgi:hypothetical protein